MRVAVIGAGIVGVTSAFELARDGHQVTVFERRASGPRSGVLNEKYKVAISRLGQRVRVAGSAELGGRLDRRHAATLNTLHKVLDDGYPGCAQWAQAKRWKGARPHNRAPPGRPVWPALHRHFAVRSP